MEKAAESDDDVGSTQIMKKAADSDAYVGNTRVME